ncbi:MAG TPA: mycobacterial-type methylenetetrahydrofolate reductase, partial [Polyangiaceae bacterium]
NMPTVAFELVPSARSAGAPKLLAEARKVKTLLGAAGILDQVNAVLVPQIIAEEGDRPVELEDKLDALEVQQILKPELPLSYILTQVTVFTPLAELKKRILALRRSGVERTVFVGVPRVFREEDVVGPYPSEALGIFREDMPSRGVIVIPTRPDEAERFTAKLTAGANFALCQLLFSHSILQFLRALPRPENEPELLLSFGYVPQVELKIGLIRWLIRDAGPIVEAEMAAVAELAALPYAQKKQRLLELYKRIVFESQGHGFRIGLHFECPYGLSEPAAETFAAMLEVWSP